MSNSDSFIDEVTEEVRRDRLFATFRKYGWIGGVLVALIVGGAAWNEYRTAQSANRAQAFGAGITAALAAPDAAARAQALAAIPHDGAQTALLALVQSSNAADKPAALAALDALANDAAQDPIYRDLAILRRVMLAGADMPLADRRTALDGISGRSYGILAREQLAYLLIEEGKTADAITALTALIQDQAAPAGLRARAEQAIIALGGTAVGGTGPQSNAG
jgi:hypothetical protein